MTSTTKLTRPLSPHLGIYRWQYSMALSILHRVTGCALSVGLLLFVYWLTALATSRDAYSEAQVVFAHPLTKLVLIGFSFAFFYHFANGIRHLMWDTGRGMERASARLSGWIAFLSAVALTIVFWVVVAARFAGSAT